MANITYRLPGKAQYSYAEVTVSHEEIGGPEGEQFLADLLGGALSALDATYPEVATPQAQAAPQAAAPAPQAGSGHTCAHGERTYRTGGPGANGKMWAAYFCPSKDRANQCKPEWVAN